MPPRKFRRSTVAPSASGPPSSAPFFTASVPPSQPLPPSTGFAVDLSFPPVFPEDIFRTKLPEMTPTHLLTRKGLIPFVRSRPGKVPPPAAPAAPVAAAEPETAGDDIEKLTLTPTLTPPSTPPTPPMLFSPTPDRSGYRRMMAKHVGYRCDGLYGVLDFGEDPVSDDGHKTTVFYVNNDVTYFDLPELDLLFPAVKQEAGEGGEKELKHG